MKSVLLSEIAFDAGTQIRAAIDERVVAEYAEAMTEGAKFPPVVLFHDGNRYYMADGFHRGMASQRVGFKDIAADVRAGTKTDALWFALGANKANGQRLTKADKKHAILLALKTWPDRSQTQMAQQIGCTQGLVSQVISANNLQDDRPDRVTGKDGKSYPATKALSTSGPRKDRASVEQRRKDIRDMASRGFTSIQIARELGISENSISHHVRNAGAVVHADRAVGRSRRHDANRIMDHIATSAEGIAADEALIDYSSLHADKLPGWIESLRGSRAAMASVIRKLQHERDNR